ncbi:DUF5624 domain-containing protein [Pseudomonas sp. BN411]|uniref:DUF5624 domain-containing protein n=1 Tax=Pseudomonas sp. BN411 TaxID=2567887 RepID=UPI0024589F31|nr:DUF5624 domain-containing protein [Pseudomonas sp. BN411]MDH4560921.1 hypothetical protein [Pseudomonas sp. BN411]
MAYMPDPVFASLFHAFTSDADSTGQSLTACMARQRAEDPLLVYAGSDVALFPGGGAAPLVESFRRRTRGFIELTAISHLPVALAYLGRMYALEPHSDAWRRDAERLLQRTRDVRERNSTAFWRDYVAVGSFAGQEEQVTRMTDYLCRVSIDYLERVLRDPAALDPEILRQEYLEPTANPAVPVPLNDLMFATFCLAFMDIIVRITGWLQEHVYQWDRLMVVLSGQSGRPTAGLTWGSNNGCHLIWAASDGAIQPEQVYLAPYAPAFEAGMEDDPAKMAELEQQYRKLWLNTRASVEVSRLMFPGHGSLEQDAAALRMSDMPPLKSIDDRAGMAARLRRIMEDPTQLLSNSVADILIDQLRANGNRPELLEIPGFTHIEYPAIER